MANLYRFGWYYALCACLLSTAALAQHPRSAEEIEADMAAATERNKQPIVRPRVGAATQTTQLQSAQTPAPSGPSIQERALSSKISEEINAALQCSANLILANDKIRELQAELDALKAKSDDSSHPK